MEKKIPDISHYQPVKDWNLIKDNAEFLISKATQGTKFVDSTLDSFIKGCEANAIPYWLYTYLNKGNEKAQAEYMIETCKEKVGENFIGYILDVEAKNTAENVKAALDYLNSLGVKTMIYTMYAEYNIYKSVISDRSADCAWWEARYGANDGIYSSKHPCHSGVDLHQYTSSGVCTGISGKCDLNRLTGTKDESWFKIPSIDPGKGKTTLELVAAVMRGTYGTRDARKQALGERYTDVQEMINHIATASITTLVTEVLEGKYGNAEIRKTVLGSRYAEVQEMINKENRKTTCGEAGD